MSRSWLFILLVFCTSQVVAQESDTQTSATGSEATRYVSDELYIFMHTGPSRNYRILGSVNAGTVLQFIEQDGDFTHVTDDQGRTGWIETQYITAELPLQQQVPRLSQQLADSQSALAQNRSALNRAQQQLNQAQQALAEAQQTVTSQAETIQALEAQVVEQDKTELFSWLIRGGLIAGGGVLLGVIIMLLPKPRKRSDTWM